MMTLKLPKFALSLTLASVVALPVLAQTPQLPPLAAIKANQLIVHSAGGDVTVPVDAGYENIGELTWSPDGQRLLFVAFDANQNPTLLLTNAFGDVARTVASPTAIGYPGSFIDANTVLYARDHADAPDASGNWLVDIYKTGLTEGAEPELIGSFASEIGCGGGSPFPADWLYEQESGFVGNPMILAQTSTGIVHSASCAGDKTAILTTAGEDKSIGTNLSRVSVSPDGAKLVGIEIGQGTADGLPQRTLVTVDLATLAETPLKTAGMPDQVTWSADGSALLYSSSAVTGKVELSADEQKAFAEIAFIDTGVDRSASTLHRFDVQTAQETTLAQLDAFVIGRISAAPNGKSVYFSTVGNMDAWVKGIANHTIDPAETAQQTAAVPVTLYQVDLSGGQPVKLIDSLHTFTLNKTSMPAS